VGDDSRLDFGDLGDPASDSYHLEPMSLQEAAEMFCRAAQAMSEAEKAEWRAALADGLLKPISEGLTEHDKIFLQQIRVGW
jgi:hypothetical protein